MYFETLKDPELQTKLREAKSPEEMLEIARECGMDLDDAQIEGVNGGAWCRAIVPISPTANTTVRSDRVC